MLVVGYDVPSSKEAVKIAHQFENVYASVGIIPSEIANYTNDLLANSQNNTANMINNLLNAYLQGYNVISNNQAQSLSTSQSNATQTQNTTTKNTDSALDWLNFINSWKNSDANLMKSVGKVL